MSPDRDAKSGGLLGAGLIAAACAVFGVLAWALLAIPRNRGLGPLVRSRLPESGVENPVTAVLLNFRSIDTLLEIAVLLLAALCVRAQAAAEREPDLLPAGPVLRAFLRGVIPVMVVTAGYLLWAGTSRPGGAFQAGAVLGGAGVLLLLADGAAYPWMYTVLSPPLLATGVVVFALVGGGVEMSGGHLLEYPPEWAGPLILVIEAAATVSIGAILAALFAGSAMLRPDKASHSGPAETDHAA